ncbi:queuosine precursor transporter [Candidatus Saccharibacteria bacterium]|nr:queuosine precursor transporter [Candidatus Saccharibacteria bacterium]
MKLAKLARSERLDVLFAVYIAAAVMVNLMGAKVMPIGTILGMQFNISVAIVLMPLLFSIVDVVCEVYNRKRANSMVRAGIITVAMMTVFAAFAVAAPAAERFGAAEAYNQVFAISVRFGIASLTAFAVSALLDVLIYSRMKARHGEGRLIWLRNNASGWAGQWVDSAVFVAIAFYSPAMSIGANLNWMLGIIIPYALAKCAMSVLTTPLVYVGVRFLKDGKLWYNGGDESKKASSAAPARKLLQE